MNFQSVTGPSSILDGIRSGKKKSVSLSSPLFSKKQQLKKIEVHRLDFENIGVPKGRKRRGRDEGKTHTLTGSERYGRGCPTEVATLHFFSSPALLNPHSLSHKNSQKFNKAFASAENQTTECF